MSDLLKNLVRSADPAEDDPGLSRSEAARMRQAMVDASTDRWQASGWLPLTVGSALALLVAAGALLMELPGGAVSEMAIPEAVVDANSESRETPAGSREIAPADRPVRRIEFVTRGGTRVLWTLDPGFDV